jgi:uncharacterized glyoxalase superfamily protein PhnB
MMLTNRSIPQSTVIPVLAYPDVDKAVDWLCDVFGFTLRVRIGSHRAQLNVGDGAVAVTEQSGGKEQDSATEPAMSQSGGPSHSVMVRIEDVNRHHEHARQRGARIVRPPADHPYGERQYTVEDFGGHQWTFSQSIKDVAPEEWGGVSGQL